MWLLLFLCLIIIGIVLFLRSEEAQKRMSIVVLGDIGRSPRMQYHALSLAKEGFDVDLIGYAGSSPHQDVLNNKKIHIYYLREPPKSIQKLPRLLVYAVKVVCLSSTLFLTLLLVRKPSCLLLQNPPAIPSLAICWLVCMMRGTPKFIIDWHNYGHTILALAVGNEHPIVKFATWYEKFFGQLAQGNICVTQAMREDLRDNWGIQAVTMYDRPPTFFKKSDLNTQHRLFSKLAQDYQMFCNEDSMKKGATVCTQLLPDGSIMLFNDRPALLVSSTSWTEDEDFSILLEALEAYELSKEEDEALPQLLCIITGKGPQKEHYMSLIAKKSWNHVQICTPWLEPEDYPRLLGSADLGVCLHKSSSGLDLPMKVVDMFGCGLPVCAVNFKCIDELVKHEENGLVFNSPEELAKQIQELLRGFPAENKRLAKFREIIKAFQQVRWDNSWKENVLPLIS